MNRVDPFVLGSLPRASSPRTKITRVPWQWPLATPASTTATVTLAGVGPVTLIWEGFDEDPGPRSREELVLVGQDGRRGLFVLDRWFALSLVAATLGSRTPRVLRPLGMAEKGVLAGYVASSLAQRHCPVMVSLDEPSLVRGFRAVSLAVRAEMPGLSGRIRFDLPAEWLFPQEPSPLQPGIRPAGLDSIRISVSVERATTTIRVSEWAAAGPGDAVLFAGCAFLTVPAWPVSLRIGDHAADAIADTTTEGQGSVVIGGPFRAVPQRTSIPDAATIRKRQIDKEPRLMSASSDEQNLNVIGAAPIEIVAEIGRLSLRGDEVLGLRRGSVLPLGHQGQVVSLLVGGQPWATGELVNVDGELGVRITELARG